MIKRMSKFRTTSSVSMSSIRGLRTRSREGGRRRIKAGDKDIFMDPNVLKDAGSSVEPFTQDQVDLYRPDELYELAYGGDVDYFMSSVFDEQNKHEIEYIKNMTRTLNVEESIHECPRCRYTKVAVSQAQIRGGDEGMTTFLRCTKCAYEWRRD